MINNQQNIHELVVELINKQLEDHNLTYDDVKTIPDWYLKYNTTPEKEKEFIEYCIDHIQRKLKISKKRAEMEAQWFILQWGLTTNPKNKISEKVK